MAKSRNRQLGQLVGVLSQSRDAEGLGSEVVDFLCQSTGCKLQRPALAPFAGWVFLMEEFDDRHQSGPDAGVGPASRVHHHRLSSGPLPSCLSRKGALQVFPQRRWCYALQGCLSSGSGTKLVHVLPQSQS